MIYCRFFYVYTNFCTCIYIYFFVFATRCFVKLRSRTKFLGEFRDRTFLYIRVARCYPRRSRSLIFVTQPARPPNKIFSLSLSLAEDVVACAVRLIRDVLILYIFFTRSPTSARAARNSSETRPTAIKKKKWEKFSVDLLNRLFRFPRYKSS